MKRVLKGIIPYIYYVTFALGVVMSLAGCLFPLLYQFGYFLFGLLSLITGMAAMYGSHLALRKNNVSLFPAALLCASGMLFFLLYVEYIGFLLSFLFALIFVFGAYFVSKKPYATLVGKHNKEKSYSDDDPTMWW